MKKWSSICLMLFTAMYLMGCEHTVAGFGKDMQNNGREIEKSVHQ